MHDNSTFSSVAHLRKILQKTQEEFAVLLDVSRATIASVESKRLELSAKLANRISQETGISELWLKSDDPRMEMANFAGKAWGYSDFETAQNKQLEPLLLYRDEEKVELCVAYVLLARALREAKKREQIPQFLKRLENYVREEIHRYGELRDEIYRELREWNERHVGTGRSYPKSFLFARSEADLEQGREEFERAIEWVKAWEKQIPPPKKAAKSPQKPRSTHAKRHTASTSVRNV